jgi:hypothetical protein
MGRCHRPTRRGVLDGKTLTPDYDEAEDILNLWVEGPRPAVTYETSEGHLVQLDPESREFIGLAIVDFDARRKGSDIAIEVPRFGHRVLQYACNCLSAPESGLVDLTGLSRPHRAGC